MLRRILELVGSIAGQGRRRRWLGVLAVLGVGLLLAAVAWSVFIPDIQIRLDPAMLLFGAAACIVAWGLYALVDRRPAAAGTIVVNYDFRLTQPTLSGGRYRFELEIFYERELRGRHERQRQTLIELVFKRSEHPDIWAFCEQEIGRFLKEHRRLASQRFPDAMILSAPPPTSNRKPRRVQPEQLPAGPTETPRSEV